MFNANPVAAKTSSVGSFAFTMRSVGHGWIGHTHPPPTGFVAAQNKIALRRILRPYRGLG
jgi:hypothetical protein